MCTSNVNESSLNDMVNNVCWMLRIDTYISENSGDRMFTFDAVMHGFISSLLLEYKNVFFFSQKKGNLCFCGLAFGWMDR